MSVLDLMSLDHSGCLVVAESAQKADHVLRLVDETAARSPGGFGNLEKHLWEVVNPVGPESWSVSFLFSSP